MATSFSISSSVEDEYINAIKKFNVLGWIIPLTLIKALKQKNQNAL